MNNFSTFFLYILLFDVSIFNLRIGSAYGNGGTYSKENTKVKLVPKRKFTQLPFGVLFGIFQCPAHVCENCNEHYFDKFILEVSPVAVN